MKLAALVSGGKDSLLAFHLASKSNKIVCLVGVISANPDSYMYHTPNTHLLDAIAVNTGLPMLKIPTEGLEEKEVEDLKKSIELLNVDGIVIGGIASNYQKSRFEKICDELGIELVSPLWGWDGEKVVEYVSKIFDAIIVKVSAMGLDREWLGRKVDEKLISELRELNKKYGINMAGEGGEYETLVVDAPFFKKRIKIIESHVLSDNLSGILIVDKFVLESK
jgi:predicted ATP pyrophosphatase (TIGR00289 family)